MEIKQEVKKHYTHISISFNQQNSLAVHLASQSIQGEKEPQEIQKEKNSMEKEKKGKQKGMVILHAPLFSFSFFSSTSPCTGPRERDQIARPAGDGSNGRAGRPAKSQDMRSSRNGRSLIRSYCSEGRCSSVVQRVGPRGHAALVLVDQPVAAAGAPPPSEPDADEADDHDVERGPPPAVRGRGRLAAGAGHRARLGGARGREEH